MKLKLIILSALALVACGVLFSQTNPELTNRSWFTTNTFSITNSSDPVFILRNITPSTNHTWMEPLDFSSATNLQIESKWEPVIKGTNAAGQWIIRFR
jgi:hypothetical protein